MWVQLDLGGPAWLYLMPLRHLIYILSVGVSMCLWNVMT